MVVLATVTNSAKLFEENLCICIVTWFKVGLRSIECNCVTLFMQNPVKHVSNPPFWIMIATSSRNLLVKLVSFG